MVARLKDVCIDANDVPVVASFWAAMLGYTISPAGDGARLDPPDDADPSQLVIWVNKVPEPKTAKTRVHLDVLLDHGDIYPLVHLGATVLREPIPDEPWWVLADPEGTELCAFAPKPSALE